MVTPTTWIALVAIVVLVLGFGAGWRLANASNASEHVEIDHDLSGQVVNVSGEGDAIVVDVDGENESYRLLGSAPEIGQDVEGTVIQIVRGDVKEEALVLTD